jgi:hypothetical protein
MEDDNSAASSNSGYREEKDDDGAITSNWASNGANSVESYSLPGINGECETFLEGSILFARCFSFRNSVCNGRVWYFFYDCRANSWTPLPSITFPTFPTKEP